MKRTDLVRPGAVVLALLLAGCERGPASQPVEAVETAKRVACVRPVRQDVAKTITQPANVLSLQEATIYAQVAGYLTAIAVDKGDRVDAGDVLAKIDVPEVRAEKKQLEASVTQAEAEVTAARVEEDRAESTRVAAEAGVTRAQAELGLQKALFDRAKDLRSEGAVSVQDVEIAQGKHEEARAALALAEARLKETEGAKRESEAHIEVAKARVATAKAQLEKTEARLAYATIRAPFSGIITRRFVDPGAMIQQATSSMQTGPIVTIAEIDRVRVDFSVPEAEVALVASGQRVTLRVDAWKGKTFEGKVARVAGNLDPGTRTMLVEAEYDNKELRLRGGMFGEATLELERHAGALTVPAEAVRTHEGKRVVFVVENGRAKRKVVTVGLDSGALIEIASGLEGSEQVIVGGRLTDDTPVIAVERKVESSEGTKE